MDGRKLVVVEANEVPRRVIEDLGPTGRIPFLSELLDSGRLIQTVADQPEPRELYPSQTWASVNTGVPFDEHGVYWYGDPKPERFPMYWQTAARSGRSVGLVNTLHSSPVRTQCGDGDYRFVVPDSFSPEPEAIPAELIPFQQANAALTAANGRTVDLRRAPAELLALTRSLPKLGLTARTLTGIGQLACGVALRRTPKERLRSGQFMLLQDLFLRLLDERSPDLAIFFTNHVAAAMHRYWYAMYPGDFEEEHYDEVWVDRYRDEIAVALTGLDRYLQRLSVWCEAEDRTLMVLSSMGQGPSGTLRSDGGLEAVIVDPRCFLDAIGVGPEIEVLGSMVPQLTLDCGSAATAAEVALTLAGVEAGEVFWDVDGEDTVVTLTYHLDPVSIDAVELAGARYPVSALGVTVYEVDDHSSGRHIPQGILGVANSQTFKPPDDGLADALDVAPAVLHHLGIVPPANLREPAFRL